MYLGKAIRLFPYSKYVLYEGDVLGGFYGINHTFFKWFGIRKSTRLFTTYEELKTYMAKRNYSVIR